MPLSGHKTRRAAMNTGITVAPSISKSAYQSDRSMDEIVSCFALAPVDHIHEGSGCSDSLRFLNVVCSFETLKYLEIKFTNIMQDSMTTLVELSLAQCTGRMKEFAQNTMCNAIK